MYVLLEPIRPKFHSVSLYGQPFRVTCHFEVCEMTTKMNLKTTNLKMPPYVLIVPQLQSLNPFRDGFFPRNRPSWDKCTEWPQNNIEHYRDNGTPYMFHY